LPTTSDSAKSETAQPTANTSWTRLAADVFSFPVMCMFLLVAVIFGYSARGIAESDIWWHLRNADTLSQFHSFPRIDTYSFSAAGSPRMNFEWLSELPFFLGFKAMGLQGLLAVYFPVLVLIYIGVYYRSCRAGADCKDAAVATLEGAFALQACLWLLARCSSAGSAWWGCCWCWTISGSRERAFGCCRHCLACGSTCMDSGFMEC
jgi:hypothetical protein